MHFDHRCSSFAIPSRKMSAVWVPRWPWWIRWSLIVPNLVRLNASQKCSWMFKPVQLLVWCQHSGYPSGRQFAHPQDFYQSSMNWLMPRVWQTQAYHSYNESLPPGHRWAICPCVIISALSATLKISNLLHHSRIAGT